MVLIGLKKRIETPFNFYIFSKQIDFTLNDDKGKRTNTFRFNCYYFFSFYLDVNYLDVKKKSNRDYLPNKSAEKQLKISHTFSLKFHSFHRNFPHTNVVNPH